jgi:hypothetical protein
MGVLLELLDRGLEDPGQLSRTERSLLVQQMVDPAIRDVVLSAAAGKRETAQILLTGAEGSLGWLTRGPLVLDDLVAGRRMIMVLEDHAAGAGSRYQQATATIAGYLEWALGRPVDAALRLEVVAGECALARYLLMLIGQGRRAPMLVTAERISR